MKKFASVFLVMALILSLLTVPSIAAEMDGDENQETTTEAEIETTTEGIDEEESSEAESSEAESSEEKSDEEETTLGEGVVSGTEETVTEASVETSEEAVTEEENSYAEGDEFQPFDLTEEGKGEQILEEMAVDEGKIYVDNIILGTHNYSGVDIDLATTMLTGLYQGNGQGHRYIVYVGETLNLSTKNADGYKFEVTEGSGCISRTTNGADRVVGEKLQAQFQGNQPGECTIELQDGQGNSKKAFIDVRYPIYVKTGFGDYHKDVLQEYLGGVTWSEDNTRFLMDPDFKRLYIKNNTVTGQRNEYIMHVGGKVTLTTNLGTGGSKRFEVEGSPQGIKIESQKEENGKVTAEVVISEEVNTNQVYTIKLDKETFYIYVEAADKVIHHFDIEIADGATYTETVTTVYSGGIRPTEKKDTEYDAEISAIESCYVYDIEGNQLAEISKGEYWDNNSGGATQHEFTSAYVTVDGQLRNGNGDIVTEAGQAAQALRDVPLINIHRVDFTVDVLLTERNGNGTRTLDNRLISLDSQNTIDANNKCPGHSGADYTVMINDKQVNVVLEGTKEITGRDWNDTLDSGKYNFTLIPVTEGAPMPANATVTNVGHDITFPAIEFTKAGTYVYKITESLGTGAPEYVKKDTKEINVTIVISDTLDNATVTCNGTAGEFTFTNTYKPTGNLKVTNTVTGEGDKQKDFHYTVELEDKTFNGTVNGVEFRDGVGEFDLKHGEDKKLGGLPPGKYTVTESDNEGYTVTQKGETGTIEANKTAQADFVNHKESKPTGNLTVSNEVTGDYSDPNKDFHYTVELDDKTINGTYGDMEFKDGKAEFDLKHGESKTATGLPAGVKYTVTESNYDDYTYTSTGETGTIVANETQKAHFVNTRTEDEDEDVDEDDDDDDDDGSTSDKTKKPKTGDSTDVGFLLALMATGLAGTIVISRRRRKENE